VQDRLIAYTDGGCRGNPGIGGWAFLLIEEHSKSALERADAAEKTTNNRMEMQAAIEALGSIKRARARILIVTDSKYLIQCCTEWMKGWKAAGWTKKRGPLLNVDLLKRLDELQAKHDVQWRHVAGHSGDPGNDHVDALLNEAMDRLAAGKTPRHERRHEWPAPLPR
jgi:ribonuclease HI